MPGVVNVTDVAVPLESGLFASVASTFPLQVPLSYSVKVTVPVGAGRPAGVPDAFATVASS